MIFPFTLVWNTALQIDSLHVINNKNKEDKKKETC